MGIGSFDEAGAIEPRKPRDSRCVSTGSGLRFDEAGAIEPRKRAVKAKGRGMSKDASMRPGQ